MQYFDEYFFNPFLSELLNSKHYKRIIKFFGVFPFIRANILVFLLLIIVASPSDQLPRSLYHF